MVMVRDWLPRYIATMAQAKWLDPIRQMTSRSVRLLKKSFQASEFEASALQKLTPSEYRSIFENELFDLSTDEYLRNPALVRHLEPFVIPYVQAEAQTLEAGFRLKIPACEFSTLGRVLLCNGALDSYAGSELWVSDTAKYLKARGAEVAVFSPNCGKVASDLSALGISVMSSSEDVVKFDPAILHVHHFHSTEPIVAKLRGRAIVFNMVHGLLPRLEMPGFADVDRYGCVSIATKAKVSALTGTDRNEVALLPNFFDDQRFKHLSDMNRTKKALLFSSRAPGDMRERLRTWLAPLGFSLDHVGYGGIVSPHPEQILPDYDLVFAVGRSAIEALASGAHVILWEWGLVGPAVTPDNYWHCVATNFSLASNTLPWSVLGDRGSSNWLKEQVLKISPLSRDRTTQLTRTFLPLSAAGARLANVYREMLRDFPKS